METELFINHQFEAAGCYTGEGCSLPPLSSASTTTAKVPRAIAMLCDAMFLFASLESGYEITPGLVDEAARNCFSAKAVQSGRDGWPALAGCRWRNSAGTR